MTDTILNNFRRQHQANKDNMICIQEVVEKVREAGKNKGVMQLIIIIFFGGGRPH